MAELAEAIAAHATASPSVSGVAGGGLLGPTPVPAPWLAIVERRIRDSVLPRERAAENDGRWLSQEVANSAIQFFQQASGVLPSEPFIYSSTSGDLVAEFKTIRGVLTSVVTQSKVLAVVMVNDQLKELTLNLETATPGVLRQSLQPIADLLKK
jgi:hypothetical protein